MTNFEKIVRGDPEAMAEYHWKSCTNFCKHGRDCGGLQRYDSTKWRTEWLNSPAKLVLSDEERALLGTAWDLGFIWMSRDESGDIFFYTHKPIKSKSEAKWGGMCMAKKYLGPLSLSWVCWQDAEPVNVRELLGEERSGEDG